MISPEAALSEIGALIAAGYPNPPADPELTLAIWLDVLDPLDDAQLHAAATAYMSSPDKDDRWWPTPGRLLALSGHGAAIRHLGSDTDGDKAWTDYNRRMRATDGIGGPMRGVPLRELDAEDGYRNDAMWAGHEAIGGWRAWARMESDDKRIPAVWRKAYLAVRGVQKIDPAAIATTARMIAPVARPALTVIK